MHPNIKVQTIFRLILQALCLVIAFLQGGWTKSRRAYQGIAFFGFLWTLETQCANGLFRIGNA